MEPTKHNKEESWKASIPRELSEHAFQRNLTRQCWWLSLLELARASGSLHATFSPGGKLFEYFEKRRRGEGGGGPVGDPIPAIGELPPSCPGNDPRLEEYVNCKNWSPSQETIDRHKASQPAPVSSTLVGAKPTATKATVKMSESKIIKEVIENQKIIRRSRLVYGPDWQRMIMFYLLDQHAKSQWNWPHETINTNDRVEEHVKLLGILGVTGISFGQQLPLATPGLGALIDQLPDHQRVLVDIPNHAMSGVVARYVKQPKPEKTKSKVKNKSEKAGETDSSESEDEYEKPEKKPIATVKQPTEPVKKTSPEVKKTHKESKEELKEPEPELKKTTQKPTGTAPQASSSASGRSNAVKTTTKPAPSSGKDELKEQTPAPKPFKPDRPASLSNPKQALSSQPTSTKKPDPGQKKGFASMSKEEKDAFHSKAAKKIQVGQKVIVVYNQHRGDEIACFVETDEMDIQRLVSERKSTIKKWWEINWCLLVNVEVSPAVVEKHAAMFPASKTIEKAKF
jgi:hypothetical protein